jgi:cell division protein FtsI/penicillin-binding protein 2
VVRARAAVLFLCLSLAAVGLGGRLVSLHIVQASDLKKIAERQQRGTLALAPARGRLLDRSGRPLAVNVEAQSVFAVPSKIASPRAFADAVAPVLGLAPADVLARLDPDRHFVWLARKAPLEAVARLRAAGLGERIGFVDEPRRVYPNGTLASHVLGFAGVDNQGLAGAELAFEAYLRGQAGLARVERDAMGRPRLETRDVTRPPADGDDVVLTIDQVLQYIAERELDRAVAETRARWGVVIIMEPPSGEILAMAAAPRFDANAYARARPDEWNNRAISTVLEPGSTFKIVVAAAALDAGAVDEHEVFTSNGILRVGGHTIREAHGRVFPAQTLADIIRNSSNVGAAMIATRLGKDRMYEAIRRFGFGAPTGIDLPGEAAGLVPPPAQWLGPGLQTIGFGQGISGTPLQVLAAGAALANDGTLVRPRVLRAVRDPEGRSVAVPGPEPVRQVVPPAIARRVMALMEGVVTDGTGTAARIDGYRVAGKTGTAQKPSPRGGYLADAYVASFLGIVPVEKPRLAIFVLLDEPRGAYYGGAVAAPVFRAVAAQALWYLRIPPAATQVVGTRPEAPAGR